MYAASVLPSARTRLSSPIQTSVVNFEVKAMNMLSNVALDVPVLPAALTWVARRMLAKPYSTSCARSLVMRYAVRGAIASGASMPARAALRSKRSAVPSSGSSATVLSSTALPARSRIRRT